MYIVERTPYTAYSVCMSDSVWDTLSFRESYMFMYERAVAPLHKRTHGARQPRAHTRTRLIEVHQSQRTRGTLSLPQSSDIPARPPSSLVLMQKEQYGH